ncbi:MAG: M23 family metallopeptidase [Candidatus Micrarchaeia archaeon]
MTTDNDDILHIQCRSGVVISMDNYTKKFIAKGVVLATVATLAVNAPDFTKSTNLMRKINEFLNQSPLAENMSSVRRGIGKVFGYIDSGIHARKKKYEKIVEEVAEKYLDGDTSMVFATIMVESEFDERCISRAGALGLMQLMPNEQNCAIFFDPRTNIEMGVKRLAELKARFGKWELAHAAYNAGPNKEPLRIGKIPQILETQLHVPKIFAHYDCFKNMSWPIRNSLGINSGYGMRVHPIYKVRRYHYGIDIDANLNEPVFSALDGRVTYAGWHGASGYRVDLEKEYRIDGCKLVKVVTLYSHLSRINVKKGSYVNKGTIIGKVGSTGISTGPHLDFKVIVAGEFVDPLLYLDGKEDLIVQKNGSIAKKMNSVVSARLHELFNLD